MPSDSDFPLRDLSYDVIGCLYNVFNELGFGHPEKIYQRAIAQEFTIKGIKYKRENVSRISYRDKRIGYYFHDFLIGDCLVLEVKVADDFYQNQQRQVLTYLRDAKLRLGIISIFSPKGVIIKRIVNPDLRSKFA